MLDSRPERPDAISSIDPSRAGFNSFDSGNIIQSVFTELTVDALFVVQDPVFMTLFSVPIITGGGDLEIFFTCGFSSPATGFVLLSGEFRLFIDSVLQRSTQCDMLFGNAAQVQLVFKATGLAPGLHTVDIEVAQDPVSVLAGVRIRPVTVPNGEHASLLIHEVQP